MWLQHPPHPRQYSEQQQPPGEPEEEPGERKELDDEDMDGELVEALRPVLRGDEAKLKALDEAARLENGSAEQCVALKLIWRSLTPAQKMQTVESSDEEDDEAAALAITTKKLSRGGKEGARKKAVPDGAGGGAIEIE